jgi:Fe-S cluster assembly protein SufD
MNKPVTIPYESLARWFHHEASRQLDSTPIQPSWLSAARSSALAAFAGAKLPTRKTENWRYTSIAALAALERTAEHTPEHSPAGQTSTGRHTQVYPVTKRLFDGTSSLLTAGLATALELVFVDGRLQPPAWQHAAVRTTLFAEADLQQQVLILEALAFLPDSQPFLLLNAGWSDDGVLIQLNESTDTLPPIVIRYVSSGEQTVSCPRIIVQAMKHSKAEIIEVFGDQASSALQAQQPLNGLLNQVTQIRLEDSASLAHYTINCETLPHGHIGFLQVNQLGHSRYAHHAFARGGVLKRRDIQVDLAASAAEALLSGVYLLAGNQHTDFHTCINHLAPHCNSQESFRGIIGGTAKAVFNGRIHIYRNAQKSSAQLSNNNLLLTSTAEVNTKPELEIYADDVKCSHGATVGQLDKQALYYCQSRGISRAEAFQMLSHAFINELLSSLPNPLIGEWFQQLAEPFYKEAMP